MTIAQANVKQTGAIPRATSSHRIDTIDSFRGLAILLVIFFHYLVRWAPPFTSDNLYDYSNSYSPMWELGRFGVEFFFIISGMVIALTVEKAQSPFDFAFRRFSRIYPTLIVSCLLTFLIVNAFGPPDLHRKVVDIVSSLLMLPAVLPSKLGFQYVDGVYWSLAVEFKFYAAVAIASYFLRGRFWVGLIIFGALGELFTFFAPNLADKIFIHQYMSFFLFGVAIAQWHFSRNGRAAALCLVSALILYGLNFDYLSLADRPSIIAAAFVTCGGGLIAFFVCFDIALNWRPLLILGRASYSLYLVHENIGIAIIRNMKMIGASDLIAMAIAFFAVVALAIAMFHCIERPAQKFLRRYCEGFFVAAAGKPRSAV